MAVLAASCAGDDDRSTTGDPGSAGKAIAVEGSTDDCTWPMAGHDLSRTHSTGRCSATMARGELDRLHPVWFHESEAEVTGAPAVDDESLYFGDWDGRLTSLARSDGSPRWEVQLPTSEYVYSGQSPASPVLAEIEGSPVVVAASGSTVSAVATADGTVRWAANLADPTDAEDPTEIEGSPIVAGESVLVPTDVHGADDYASGLVSLRLTDGTVQWRFDPEQADPEGERPARGCGAVWGSPGVDTEAGLVVVGTGNCSDEDAWTEASEAIVGIDLGTGEMRWSFQPHEKGNDNDWDFAGAPNLYEIDGRPVAGLGNKDGNYYVVDRTDGELVWSAEAQKQSGSGDGFAFGGFIGALTLVDGVLIGGTAVGDCPCQHAFDAATGELIWQNNDPTGTYAAAAGVAGGEGGFAFQTGIDQTLRAFDATTGEVLWDSTLPAISSSGPSIAGDELFIGVGFREPGSPATGGGGVQAFRVLAEGESAPSSSTTTVPEGPGVSALAPVDQACVGAPCSIPFTLKEPPVGTAPTATLTVLPDPLSITVEVTDLGEPGAWLDADGAAARDGATTFMVFMTPRDDKPELGSVLCTFEAGDDGCEADEIPVPAEQWTRLSIVATVDERTPPSLQEGFDRLVTTHSFDPALTPA